MVCVALAFLLPISVTGLVGEYSESLVRRSRSTPLVAGAVGSRYDLVLSSLYFAGRMPRELSMREADELTETGFAAVVPVALGQTAREFPLVGTTPEYFKVRELAAQRGELPLLLGEAVIGVDVADQLGVDVGDTLLTDDGSLYDLSLRSPLELQVVGVLERVDTPDDRAVFVDLKTSWIGLGIGHGHVDPVEDAGGQTEDEGGLERQPGEPVVLGASTYEFTSFTPENRARFHFHGEREDFPVSALLLFPRDARSSTVMKGRYRLSEELQLLNPEAVVDELLGLVFRAKRFFDANSLLVSISTALFLLVVLSLSLRVRRKEIETLTKIGCSNGVIAGVIGSEFAILIFGGLALSFALSQSLAELLRHALLA